MPADMNSGNLQRMFKQGHNQENHKQPSSLPLQESFLRDLSRTCRTYKLGDLLVISRTINRYQLNLALTEQAQTGEQLGKILIRQGAVSAVQLYRKLAEQWCLKVSAAGITLLMQATAPSAAQADALSTASNSLSAPFTLAAATIPANTFKTTPAPERYPALFGSQEVKSDDISAFRKWTSVIQKFEDQYKTVSAKSPRIMLWKAEIQKLRDKSPREQIEGVNDFLNTLTYKEDIANYGQSDYWSTPIEFLTRGGDCEDFAIAKYASLRALGFSSGQLRIAIVQDEIKNIPHAVLIVYSDDGNFVLDNQNKKTETIAAVTHYKPIFSLNSTSWWLHKT